MIKLRKMRWAGYVTCMGKKRNAYRVLVGQPEGKNPLEDLDVGGRIILKWILEKQDMVVWTAMVWLRIAAHGRPL
jgi:hypothetical protein